MYIIYLISIIAIVKLFKYFYKRNNANAKEIINNYNNSEHDLDAKSSMETTKELEKNKWLYPDDEFVKYKKEKHYKSKNYNLNN